ncbi:hypothetical protein ACOTVS_11760 [Aliarcobacter butzleri]|uniref:hypothetical protein n=1 Tax=Aliarcobacter butzleri TaxID=28197 RepID=UPI00344D238B
MDKYTFNEFVNNTKINFIENCNCYGHHPMQLISINKRNELNLTALMHLRLIDVKNRFKEYFYNEDNRDLMLSLDFPKNDEIKNDFIMLLHFNDKKLINLLIREYNPKNGEFLQTIEDKNLNVVKEIVKLLTNI